MNKKGYKMGLNDNQILITIFENKKEKILV